MSSTSKTPTQDDDQDYWELLNGIMVHPLAMENANNNCYFNAVLITLLTLPHFFSVYNLSDPLNTRKGEVVRHHLCRHLLEYIQILQRNATQPDMVYSPDLNWVTPLFGFPQGSQEDARELLQGLLEHVHQDDIGFSVKVEEDKNVSYYHDVIMVDSLSRAVPLLDILSRGYSRFSAYIAIQYERFNAHGHALVSRIPLSMSVTPPQSSSTYRLQCLLCHQGPSPTDGHYYCVVRWQERWYMMNDHQVVLIPHLGQFVDQQHTHISMLFYSKVTPL